MNLMNGLTITLIGCQKLILSSCNVWARITGDRILKPVFLDGNLDEATYLIRRSHNSVSGLFPNPLDPDLPDMVYGINRTELHPIML
jgi:hypothetical protein